MQPGEPSQGHEGFAEAHVIGEDAAEAVGGQVGEEVESGFLVGPQSGGDGSGKGRGDAGLDFTGAALEQGGLIVREEGA